jgi:integrase
MADVWTRFCVAATDTAGIPETFTPYNARHTGISWAIDKGVDLQKVRQRAGHGSLEVTSRYAAILDDRDTSLADALEEIFDTSRTPVGRQEKTAELHDAAAHHAPVPAAEPDWLLSPWPRLRSPSRPGREAVAALDAHTFATLNLDVGASLRDLQDAMGHASPRATRRYDRSRGNLDRSPGYLLAGYLSHAR